MNIADFSTKASIGLTQRIPGGYFYMGSRFHPRESPSRSVKINEFDIASIPVTISQYKVFIDAEGYQQQRWWSHPGRVWINGLSDGWGREDRSVPDGWSIQKRRESHPIVGVTWFEAEAYCNWLSFLKKKTIRLPLEQEWEFAARGMDGRPYPWGEEFDKTFTNTLETEIFDTVEVASIQSDCSPFDVHDMAGNIQEWTASDYSPLANEAFPEGPIQVARGGSFNDTAYGSRTSYRRGYPPGYFFSFLGFRIVVESR